VTAAGPGEDGGVAELTGLAGVAADVMETLGAVGVGVLVLVENLFPPIPSEVVLPLAGYLASRGRMDLTLVIFAATLGSVLGALILYEAGARFGRDRLRRLVDRMPLMEIEDLDKAEQWFARHGEVSVLIGRCLPVVRSLISVPAGVEGMPRWRFTVLTTVGSGVWNTAFVLAGWALGAQFTEVERYSSWLNTAVYVAIVVLLALGVRRALRRRSKQRAQEP
jgi:membrane protein DedA with SNARE-associated domain